MNCPAAKNFNKPHRSACVRILYMDSTEVITLKSLHRPYKVLALLLSVLFVQGVDAAPAAHAVIVTNEAPLRQQLWLAQTPPNEEELGRYTGLHAATAMQRK